MFDIEDFHKQGTKLCLYPYYLQKMRIYKLILSSCRTIISLTKESDLNSGLILKIHMIIDDAHNIE